jgi:N-acyl homoserine lactone hydrolase
MNRKEVLKTKKLICMLSILSCFFLAASFAYAAQPAYVKLYAFQTGTMHFPDRGVLAPGYGGKPIGIPIPVYLIIHPKGNVLIDTGINPAHFPKEFPKTDYSPEMRIDNQLAKLGLTPKDIKYVIMTHLHVDHAGWMTLFPNSTFIVRKAELRQAWWPDRFPWLGVWLYDDFKDTRDYKFVQLDDTEDFDVFLDGSVVCMDSKGHTVGHQSVLLNLPKSGKMLVAGDAVYLPENLDPGVVPGFSWSGDWSMKTVAKIQHMNRNGVRVLLGHDPESFKKLPVPPAFYE